MNISLKKLLVLSFSAMVLAVILVSALSLTALRSTNQRFGTYVDDIAYRESLVNQLLDAVKDTSINTYGLVLVSEAQDIELGKQRIGASRERTQQALAQFRKTVSASREASQDDAGFAEQIGEQLAAFEKSASDVMNLALAEKKAQAIVTMNQEVRPRLQDLFATTQKYLAESGKHAAESVQAAKSLYAYSLVVLISAGVLSALGAGLLGWFIIRSVFASLGSEPAELGVAVSKVAAGDLREVAGAGRAPSGSVLSNIGKMQKQLHGLIGAIEQSTQSIVGATSEIAAGNMDLSSRTETQAAALEETAATMDLLTVTVRNNAENARKGMSLSAEASRVAQLGGETVERVVETMTEINSSSRQVGQIISVIESIAFQTNILALNAAVEAARAGEHGRGFAVVATEVRNLAHRSAAASREIKQLIDQSFDIVGKGSTLVTEAGSTMSEVVAAVRSVTDLMAEIARAANEQRLGIEQINEAVSNMDSSTQQNAALVEQGAAAASSLQNQAQSLRKAVSVFDTGYMEIAA